MNKFETNNKSVNLAAKRQQHRVAILLALTAMLSACESDQNLNNELVELRAELQQVRSERDKAQQAIKGTLETMDKERYQWMDQNYALKQKIKQLEENKRNCVVVGVAERDCLRRNREMKEWVHGLITAIGPAIWVPSKYEHPMYLKAPDDVSIEGVIEELNGWLTRQGSPTLVLKGREGNILVVSVTDDEQLTERMSSFGARSYISSAIYTLTSLSEIDCVRFDFKEGSHATPGKRCRE